MMEVADEPTRMVFQASGVRANRSMMMSL